MVIDWYKKRPITIRAAILGGVFTVVAAILSAIIQPDVVVVLPTSASPPTLVASASPSTVLTTPTAADITSPLPQSYDVGEDFRQNCINTGHWEPYAYLSTSQAVGREVPAPIFVLFKLGCMDNDAQDAWGFYATNGLLAIRKQQEQDSTIYGLSTPLPESSIIELRLLVNQSSTGEIYLGVLSKSRADPLSAGETFISVHPDNIIQLVTTALGTLDSYPFATGRVYKLRFEVATDKLQVSVNDGEKIFETTGNFSSSHFMIGYRLDNGQAIDATISDLSIQRR